MSMYTFRCIVYLIVLLPIILCSCGKKWYEYNIDKSNPRAVYLNEQIKAMETVRTLQDEDKTYIDLRMRNGDNYSGLLKRIDSDNIVFAQGYSYTTTKDSVLKVEKLVSVAKKDIAFIKIW